MKKIIFSLALVSVIVFGICWSRTIKESRFNIAGRVEVPERLLRLAQADNNSLAIIIKNEADVPVAIKRVVNPRFPLEFVLGEKDLLTEKVEGNLKIEVQINNHGQLGVIKQGDIFGSGAEVIHSNDKEVLVLADKTMGRVQLARPVKGNFFRTAAR